MFTRKDYIIRDLFGRAYQKFTSTAIAKAIEKNSKESRKRWMLRLLKKEDKIWFWEEGYHGEEIISISFFESKMLYIHLNPVRAGLVEKEVEYLYSSCGDLYGVRKGLLELAVFQISELADWKSFLYVLRDALRNISNSGVEDN